MSLANNTMDANPTDERDVSDVTILARRTAPSEGFCGAIELAGTGWYLDQDEAIALRDSLTVAIDKPRLDAREHAEVVETVGDYALIRTPFEWCVRELLNPRFEENGEAPEYDHAWYLTEAEARPVIEDERGRAKLLALAEARRVAATWRCISCRWRGPRSEVVVDHDGQMYCPNCGGLMLREVT